MSVKKRTQMFMSMNVFHVSLYTSYLERLGTHLLCCVTLPQSSFSSHNLRNVLRFLKKEAAAKILDAKYIAIKRLLEYLQ